MTIFFSFKNSRKYFELSRIVIFFNTFFFLFGVHFRFRDIKDEETVPHKSPMEHSLPCLSRYRTRFSTAALKLVSDKFHSSFIIDETLERRNFFQRYW